MLKLNDKYEVLTPDGWCDFSGVMFKGTRPTVRLTLGNGIEVTATADHTVFSSGREVHIKDLTVGAAVDVRGGSQPCLAVVPASDGEPVFDLVGVTNNAHAFLANSYVVVRNCDEFSFVHPNMSAAFWAAIRPVLATGGQCIITSTPKNDEDQFAQIWKEANNNTDKFGNRLPGRVGRNGFFPVLAPWWEHPDRDEKWAEEERASLGEARFRQEHCCEFVTDDETLINPLALMKLEPVAPAFYTDTTRWYAEPQPNRSYLVALDPSLGTGRDYAAIEVFQLPEMIQIAEWQHNGATPRDQVRAMMRILFFLDGVLRDNPEQLAAPDIYWTFENNSIGEAVLQIVEDTGEDRFPGTLVSERRRKGVGGRRFRKGMMTTNRSKLSGAARLKSLVETGRVRINSANLIHELKNYVAHGPSFAAKPGEHDDLASALLLIARMLDVVLHWNSGHQDLREYIEDDELGEADVEPMAVVV